MIDFHLSVEPQTEQRLRKILSQVQDTEMFVRNIISYQIA